MSLLFDKINFTLIGVGIWTVAILLMVLLLIQVAFMLINPPGPPNSPAQNLQDAQRYGRWDVHSRIMQFIAGGALGYLIFMLIVIAVAVFNGQYAYSLVTLAAVVVLWRTYLLSQEVVLRQEEEAKAPSLIVRPHPNEIQSILDHRIGHSRAGSRS